MKILVKVKTNSETEKIEKVFENGENYLKVTLKAPPHNNLANINLINLLASYYEVNKNQVNIIKGLKNKIKLIEII
jgi:uncharacterized protein YggU (UPF0235/DUF167 family)